MRPVQNASKQSCNVAVQDRQQDGGPTVDWMAGSGAPGAGTPTCWYAADAAITADGTEIFRDPRVNCASVMHGPLLPLIIRDAGEVAPRSIIERVGHFVI